MKRPSIAQLAHRVAVCSQQDVVIDGDTINLVRRDAYHAWCAIENKMSSMYSPNGMAIMDDRNRQTHIITVRFRRDIDIASTAWLYEERLQSGNRWFKVLGIKETDDRGEFMVLSCRLIERGSESAPPVADGEKVEVVKRANQGVKL